MQWRREALAASDATGAPQAGQPTPATPAPTTTAITAPTAQPTATTQPDPTDDGDGGSQAEKLRREAANYRTKLREAEKALNDLSTWKAEQERAAMSDAERRDADIKKHSALAAELQAKLDARDAENRRLLTDQAIITTATALREGDNQIQWHDLSIVLKLVDRDAIEYDDNGQPTNVTKLLKSLAKSSPFLVRSEAAAGPPTPSVSPTNPPRGGAGSLLTLADIGRMTPQQVAALPRETVAAAMSNGRQ